mgnify:FL=1
MLKRVLSRFTSAAVATVFILFLSSQAFGSHHEDAKEEQTQEISTDGLQNEEWKNAPTPQGLDSKRYSPYALDSQLENDLAGGEENQSKTLFYFLLTVIILLLLGVLGTSMKLVKGLARLSGAKDEEPDYNTINARLLLAFLFVFLGGVLYETIIHKEYILPDSASEHGESIDMMLWITMGITGFVFVVTQILLFGFAFKYRQKKGQKALYYPHNDKLEILWTTIPAIALTVLVLFGFRIWVNTTMTNPENSQYEIELYAYQFGWKIRYPGPDGKLGRADYRLLNFDPEKGPINEVGIDSDDPASKDDIVSSELVLPKEAMVQLKMRSRDVLHAAHLPHFRAQMYCVPGTPTQFTLKPLYTTEEFRDKINKPEFNFELACNQICGSSHFNMRKEILVVEEADYNAWMKGQKAFFSNNTEDSDKQLTLREEK